jgi:hypothetical protein
MDVVSSACATHGHADWLRFDVGFRDLLHEVIIAFAFPIVIQPDLCPQKDAKYTAKAPVRSSQTHDFSAARCTADTMASNFLPLGESEPRPPIVAT